MGPVAALLCLSEVLKPIAKSIYKAKLCGQRQLEVRAAAANYVDDDLDIDNLQGDSWRASHRCLTSADCLCFTLQCPPQTAHEGIILLDKFDTMSVMSRCASLHANICHKQLQRVVCHANALLTGVYVLIPYRTLLSSLKIKVGDI